MDKLLINVSHSLGELGYSFIYDGDKITLNELNMFIIIDNSTMNAILINNSQSYDNLSEIQN